METDEAKRLAWNAYIRDYRAGKGREQVMAAQRRYRASAKGRAWKRKSRKIWKASRRAADLGLFVEDIDIRVLYERDEGICGICGLPVDKALRYPDPMSKSHDHVIPLSKGGLHSYANAQLAHLTCNIRKSNKLEGDSPREN